MATTADMPQADDGDDRPVALEPLSARDRLIACPYFVLITGGIVLGAWGAISPKAWFVMIGATQVLYGLLAATNMAGTRDRGLTVFDLDRRMTESADKRVSLLRPLARIDAALYGWLSRPSRIAATRIFVSSVMVFIGLLFLESGLLAHFAPGH